jgi:carboxyl-terminal processing protease
MLAVRKMLVLARRLQLVLIIMVVFVAGFAVGTHTATTFAQGLSTTPPPEAQSLFEPFWQVYNLIQNQYLEPNDREITPEQLLDGALNGLVDALGDQHSAYMSPEIFYRQNEELSGEFQGIGATIRYNETEDAIEVISVFEGSPAQIAGIRPGDIFVAVDGEDVTGENQTQVAFRVRGPEGTVVELTMRRGDELIEFSIVRARIEIPNIEASIEDGNIGYIRLYQFTQDARRQLDSALDEIVVNERDGLIFDLRGNPGGLFSSAIDVTSAFIEEGIILIEDFGEGREPLVFRATGNYAGIDVPIVVLIDEGSASASEIVAGALQDMGLATIIGETTLGKGTVQTWRELVNGGGVRLTIARWKTPNGTWIHEQGIMPDVLVEWQPEGEEDEVDVQLQAAIDYISSLVVVPQ